MLMDSDIQNVEPNKDLDVCEKKHFLRVINAFRNYRSDSLKQLYKKTKFIESLPQHQQELIESYKAHLHKVHTSIEKNFVVINIILQDVFHLFEDQKSWDGVTVPNQEIYASDMEKVQGVFKQLLREWSVEGEEERKASFCPILDELVSRFPEKQENIQVLVPGAGLGRLAYEIAKLGFASQGNEFSLYMLFVSNFILNKCKGCNLYEVCPWATVSSNHFNSNDQLMSITFPDEDPSKITNSEFSMAAGNFIEIYKVPDLWDCITTCFFLDTAKNIIDYIETIWTILKPGGFWINIGPLLYHHADMPNQDSIEPSYEDIRLIIEKIGFSLCKEVTNISTPYGQNTKSMLSYDYRSVFFVCQKPQSHKR